jgi:hypothetical protein
MSLDNCELQTTKAGRPLMADIEGTMVIRAWAEPAQNNQLRARLISSGPGHEREVVESAADAEQILLAVRRWLDSLRPEDHSAGAPDPVSR